MLMITKEVIKEVYKKYRKKPKSIDRLDVALLRGKVGETHGIEIVDNKIVINSLAPSSLFNKISLSRVHGIVNFEKTIAIVLHSSILFLDKDEPKQNIHIKPQPQTFMEKVKMWFGRW